MSLITGPEYDLEFSSPLPTIPSRPNTPTLPIEVSSLSTTSSKIRALHKMGFKQYTISKMLNIRPQFVSNVVNRPLKKS